MPKSELSAPGDHTPVDNRPDYSKSGVTEDLLRRVGKSNLRAFNALGKAGYNAYPDMQKNDMRAAEEISDAVPRRKD